jgi:predicted amidophosphoribosyltransferase
MHSRDDTDARTPVGDLLDRFKYGGDRSLRDTLGRALARVLAHESQFQGVYAAVHVPGSSRRGQPEPARDLACVVARALRVRCFPRLIARTRPVAPQKDITFWNHKQANVRGAFRVRRPDLVKGRRLLLVDDVYDSGATLEEGWRALAEAGAGEVVVAAITKTRYRRED